ncbi:SpoIIE family protein phosphatase [Desulfovibrio mangrovi]|uniref:PP2C family protein-serine/threonine phosphatase n=1 Tax=Desulfovibrio mangrovi TaxID=2976983 RepID=UPI0022475DBF|nr:GAF domain-containing SpoIIE family protein phosphatase [Desulfovibrio mangrovi]UZP66556.1 SpoIIE family protein phosphatase [Desulfovibrio mangrovi]
MRKLIQANQMLAQTESLPELLPRLLELAQDVTEAVASSILLYDSAEHVLRFALARNDTPGIAQQILEGDFTLRMGEGIAGTVAVTRTSVMCSGDDVRINRVADAATGFKTRSLICVPILYKDELLGVAQVLNSHSGEDFTTEDLEILESFAHLAGVALVRSKLLEALLEQERMTVQLQAAARIQQAFLPKLPTMPNGSHIWATSKPAIHVGGDMYDCISLSDGRLVTYIADVAGKGLGAALVGTAVWSRIRSHVQIESSPSNILKILNEMLLNDMENSLFVTVCIAVYDSRNHTVTLANAGHLQPIVASGGEVRELSVSTGLPLGIEPDVPYIDTLVELQPGQAILLLSDGITEAYDAAHVMYGDERVMELLHAKSEPPYGEALMAAVDLWQEGVPSNDDKTVLEVWRDPS